MSLFNPLVPTGLVKLDTDYKNLQNNFQQLDTSFGVNHVKFSVTPNNGKHRFVEMPSLGPDPSLPFPLVGTEGTIFTNSVTRSAVTHSELFYIPDGTGQSYQLTQTISAKFATFATNPGWTFLPGGLILNYGSVNIGSTGSAFPVLFSAPFTSIPFSVTLGFNSSQGNSPGANSAFIKDGTLTISGFSLTTSSSGGSLTPIFYMAIGV